MGAPDSVHREGASEPLRRQITSKRYRFLLDLAGPGVASEQPPWGSGRGKILWRS